VPAIKWNPRAKRAQLTDAHVANCFAAEVAVRPLLKRVHQTKRAVAEPVAIASPFSGVSGTTPPTIADSLSEYVAAISARLFEQR